MPGSIGPATVNLEGGLYVQGCTINLAKVSFLGNSPNATVKIYSWDEGSRRFTEYDKLTGASVSDDERTGMTIISGLSEMVLTDMPGADESDALVTWKVKVTGQCADCA